MTELERALVLLGRELDFPAEPDLRSRVRERIERKRRVRRALVFAVALVVRRVRDRNGRAGCAQLDPAVLPHRLGDGGTRAHAAAGA